MVPIYSNPFLDSKSTPIEDTYITALENLEGATVKLYGPYLVPTKRFVQALVKAAKEMKAGPPWSVWLIQSTSSWKGA